MIYSHVFMCACVCECDAGENTDEINATYVICQWNSSITTANT